MFCRRIKRGNKMNILSVSILTFVAVFFTTRHFMRKVSKLSRDIGYIDAQLDLDEAMNESGFLEYGYIIGESDEYKRGYLEARKEIDGKTIELLERMACKRKAYTGK